jgi:hypothetical protein
MCCMSLIDREMIKGFITGYDVTDYARIYVRR